MALYLQQVADSIGLKIELDDKAPLDWVQGVMSATTKPSFDLTFNYSSTALNDAFASFLRVLPDSIDNYSGYDDPDVTALIGEGRASVDDAERAEIAGQIEAKVLDALPIIPVSWVPRQVFVSSDIGGAVLSDASFMGFPWAATLGAK
jgi:peptide/nickel transport system substrate-binding protein